MSRLDSNNLHQPDRRCVVRAPTGRLGIEMEGGARRRLEASRRDNLPTRFRIVSRLQGGPGQLKKLWGLDGGRFAARQMAKGIKF